MVNAKYWEALGYKEVRHTIMAPCNGGCLTNNSFLLSRLDVKHYINASEYKFGHLYFMPNGIILYSNGIKVGLSHPTLIKIAYDSEQATKHRFSDILILTCIQKSGKLDE